MKLPLLVLACLFGLTVCKPTHEKVKLKNGVNKKAAMVQQIKKLLQGKKSSKQAGTVIGTVDYSETYSEAGNYQEWVFEATDPSSTLTIEFTSLNLVSDDDMVVMMDSGDEGAIMAVLQDGSDLQTFNTKGPKITIEFVSFGMSSFQGDHSFNVVVTEVSTSSDSVVGTIDYQKPNSADGYAGDFQLWEFEATDPTSTLAIEFTTLTLASPGDIIIVIDGDTALGGLDGDADVQTFYTTGPKVNIMLRSNGYYVAGGFNAVITEIPAETNTVVGTVDYAGPYDMGGDYQVWEFDATDSTATLALEVTSMNLIDGLDYVFIYDGDSGSPVISPMAGSFTPQTFYSTGAKISVAIISVGSNWGHGQHNFNAVITEVPPTK